MTSSPPAETRVRECDCPLWVERCAHASDGRRLVLASHDKLAAQHDVACGTQPLLRLFSRYVVDIGHLTNGDYCCGITASIKPLGIFSASYDGDDYDAAIAAFRRAEEELLAGDAP